MSRFTWIIAASIVLVAAAGVLLFRSSLVGGLPEAGSVDPATTGPECPGCNVLIITIDTVRARSLGVYGYERDTSPHLDRFAEDNVLFERAYVQIPFTAPSHWSIFTGLYPHNHHIWNYWEWEKATDDPAVEQERQRQEQTRDPRAGRSGRYAKIMADIVDRVRTLPFLPAALQERGYATAAFTSSVMVRTLEPFFDTYRMTQDDGSTAAFYETTHNAMQWLDEHGRDREFLLWIHYWDAHAPYEPIAEYDLFAGGSEDRFESDRASYDGEIRFLDHKIDRILDKLDELELGDETIVIIVSDHGENFGEHDCSDFTGKDQRCKGHYVSLLEPEIKVPLVMRIPGVRSTRVNEIVQTVDLLPTVLELLGLESEHALDGRSVLPLVRGEAQGPRYSYAELKKKKRSSRSLILDRWKLITIVDEENDRTTTKLYDLEHGEYDDLSTLDPETAARLERRLRDLVQGKQLVPETIDEESERMLRALGYIE